MSSPREAPDGPATRPVTVGLAPVAPVTIGGDSFTIIAGPCAIESADRFRTVAEAVRAAGAVALRGGIFKLRTDRLSFQGLREAGYAVAREVRESIRMPFVSELTDPRQIEPMRDFVDVFQVGTRNMFNYDLLAELGRAGRPVLLKRGFGATVDEWLKAADYVTAEGNCDVILCERGIRTFEPGTRATLDLTAVPIAKRSTSLPVIVDPSHAAGHRSLVTPLALAAAAVGADGLLVEVHDHPDDARSDGAQSLDLAAFRDLVERVTPIVAATGRTVDTPSSVPSR